MRSTESFNEFVIIIFAVVENHATCAHAFQKLAYRIIKEIYMNCIVCHQTCVSVCVCVCCGSFQRNSINWAFSIARRTVESFHAHGMCGSLGSIDCNYRRKILFRNAYECNLANCRMYSQLHWRCVIVFVCVSTRLYVCACVQRLLSKQSIRLFQIENSIWKCQKNIRLHIKSHCEWIAPT